MKVIKKQGYKKIDEIIEVDAKDNEWNLVETSKDKATTLSCCDCGLAHFIEIKKENGIFYLKLVKSVEITDNNRKTKTY